MSASSSGNTRALGLALAAAAAGCATIAATRDPLVFLAWLALAAIPIGVWLGGARARDGAAAVPLWPWAALVPGAWMIAFAALAAERSFPGAPWAACAWTGMFLAGFGLGRCAGHAVCGLATTLAALGVVLGVLPAGAGLVSGAFSPAATARLLDLSPVTQLVESAGVDWMRNAAPYEPARTLDIGPELRGPFRGALAGPLWLLFGCGLAGCGALLRSRSAGPEPSV